MASWDTAITELESRLAAALSFQSFIAQWGYQAGEAASRVFLHELPPPAGGEEWTIAEIESTQKAQALIRVPEDGGLILAKQISEGHVAVGGVLELDLFRLMPHNLRHDMSAVLQQAVTATAPIVEELMEDSTGLLRTIVADGHPWRTHPDDAATSGDLHGVSYLVTWGHPTVAE